MTDVVAALIWEGDRFFACQRPAHKARGLLWEFVGGKVEPGETKQHALIRECREELAVEIAVGERFMELIHVYPDITVRLSLYNAAIISGSPVLLEHNDMKWLTTAEIDDYAFCPADEEILSVLKTISGSLQARLYALRGMDYKRFQTGLLPSVDPDIVLGVRMPDLRKLARTLTAEEKHRHLYSLPHRYYDENNLHGLLVNEMADYEAAVRHLNAFLPHVDNWATCDLLAPRAFQRRPEALVRQIRKWLDSDHVYTVRFGIGMLLKHYLGEGFTPEHLDWVARIRSNAYYVNMMIAWYFATALAKQYPAAIKYIEQRRLPVWVHNKTIQKAVESYRIAADTKEYLKTLRRK